MRRPDVRASRDLPGTTGPSSRRGVLRLLRLDDGAALVSVLYLLVALTAITTTVAVVATNDIISSGRDQQATAALATADAGVSQALEFIRLNGVGSLRCMEAQSAPTPSGACATPPATTNARWSSPVNPQQVRLDGAVGNCVTGEACYKVWISALTRYDPPAVKTGTYRIHSTGYFGGGPGAKAVVVDVEATPAEFPVGVFGEGLDGNGGTRIFNESLFTRACISPRNDGSGNGTRFQGIDPYWDQPAAANTTDVVSTGNNCSVAGRIHSPTLPCATGTGNVLINDRDSLGGSVVGTPCFRTYTRADGTTYPPGDTSRFTLADLQSYGYRPGGLSDAQYDALKVQAQGLGLHNPTSAQVLAGLNAAVAAGVSHPVVYFDSGADVSLDRNDIPAVFGRAPGGVGTCAAPYAVVVVVRQADLTYQGGNVDWRSMAVFVPEGDFRGNGGYNIVGTLFADNISLGGNEHWELDDCFVDNMPGPLMQLNTTTFREDDRVDVP